MSAWVDGAVTLRVGVLLASGVSGVCGLRRRSRLPFVVRHLFPVCWSFTFSGVGVAWSQVCGPSCDSWVLDSSFAPCVRVLQLQWCLLGLTVRSPLGWVCFWPLVSLAFVGCEGGLGCPSWFVIFFLSVGPSPFLGLGWLGHRFVAPPATPGFWTLLTLGCAVLTP